MNIDNVDADEIITNSRLKDDKTGGKTIGDGADGHNTDSTIPSDTAKNRNSQTRQGGNREEKGKTSKKDKPFDASLAFQLEDKEIPAKEIRLAKILMDKPAPHCSASSWAVFDQKTNSLLFGKMEKERREVASLTKIMTCYVVLKLLERFQVEETTLVKVGSDASSVIGTSAELVEGDTLTI